MKDLPDSGPRWSARTCAPLAPLLCLVALAFSVACSGAAAPAAKARAESKASEAKGGGEPNAAGGEAEPAAWADEDADGIPDRAELRTHADRENFRAWFTAIAETQFYQLSKEWKAEQRDCAGLVRFAWREALRRHDRAWLRRMGEAYEQIAPDVRAFDLERGPLGEKLFRTAPGAFERSDLGGSFSEFADARTLKDFNAEFVSRDPERARPGDLLFFHQPWVQEFPYHVMIYLGRAREDTGGGSDWVVYHTGSSATDAGEVKKVRLSVLERHPSPRWRPVKSNRNFLGFYALKILQ